MDSNSRSRRVGMDLLLAELPPAAGVLQVVARLQVAGGLRAADIQVDRQVVGLRVAGVRQGVDRRAAAGGLRAADIQVDRRVEGIQADLRVGRQAGDLRGGTRRAADRRAAARRAAGGLRVDRRAAAVDRRQGEGIPAVGIRVLRERLRVLLPAVGGPRVALRRVVGARQVDRRVVLHRAAGVLRRAVTACRPVATAGRLARATQVGIRPVVLAVLRRHRVGALRFLPATR